MRGSHDRAAEKPSMFSIANPVRRLRTNDDEDGTRAAPRFRRRVLDAFKAPGELAFVQRFLSRNAVRSSVDGRRIPLAIDHDKPLVDSRRGHGYISNHVRTSRYTVWDFFPKQLLFQFSRVGNFYFLCVGVPQMVPGLSTTGSYTTIMPLLFFVFLTMAKEGYDDYRRHRLDKIENANLVAAIRSADTKDADLDRCKSWKRHLPFQSRTPPAQLSVPDESANDVRWRAVRWSEVRVGDIIQLQRDDTVPADMVLLHSDGEDGLAYIETMALDGETNLKTKQVPPALQGCDTIEEIAQCDAEFIVEDPNANLYSFDGRVTTNRKDSPLTLKEVVYRGSVLRNTTRAMGIVINTGEECKIRMNSNQHPRAKKPALEKMVDKVVITLAAYVLLLSTGLSIGYIRWKKTYENQAWYLIDAAVPFHQIIIAFIIMFNNVIPLSLYISLEIVKVGQLLLLNADLDMYNEMDTPSRCNTNTILENLGQIEYIFSDKTGTLTENVMKFRKISIAGTIWLHETDLDPTTEDSSSDHSTSKEWCKSPSIHKAEPITSAIYENEADITDRSMSLTRRPSLPRRSSSHWRSTGRPDHAQPEVNTLDLLEYLRHRPHSAFSRKAKECMLAMALCHTCLPEMREGKAEFQSSSPDELALVTAAQELGFAVVERTSQRIVVQLPQPNGHLERVSYQILDIIEFSSARKRMTIIVRCPDGRVLLICKGADSAILLRLRQSSLAMQKASEVRKSADLERELHRRSEHQEPRNSFGGRRSLVLHWGQGSVKDPGPNRRSMSFRRKSFDPKKLTRFSNDHARPSLSSLRGPSFDVSRYQHLNGPSHPMPVPERLNFLDDPVMYDEAEVFSKCFKHLNEFATEGLRTLLYAQKYIPESDYLSWKKAYDDASTSLVDRQERIELAGDSIEQALDLVAGTAIEDKLQRGVPDTIDRLRRANIKIWMLTGDKRETAINIAHSARICRPESDLFVVDVAKGSVESQLKVIAEELEAASVHSVVVIDGHTLSVVENSTELSGQFYTVMTRVDSVICCRASPAQKSLLVQAVRSRLAACRGRGRRGLTLAIGDGANDLAMIQASHVGVGISGREGLQAARVADYAIAQFRYLQRLLLVHGRWNYVRTAKFIICTFWKELFFYLPAAQYQKYNGYTGTSLYQDTSLTVFNTLFTSLCTICMGIWEQDLRAETLLAVPELYVYGQRNMGLNMWRYVRWMAVAALDGIIIWSAIWAGYGRVTPDDLDEGLYALGTLVFTTGVLWINWKLFILETHFKARLVIAAFFVTTAGWFAWLAFLDGVYASQASGPYAIRHAFTRGFGKDVVWWSTLFATLGILGLLAVCAKVLRRQLLVWGAWQWPPFSGRGIDSNVEEWDFELWQEVEQDPTVRERLGRLAKDADFVEEEEGGEDSDAVSGVDDVAVQRT